MPSNSKRVFYVEFLTSDNYEKLLTARPDIRLDRIEPHDDEVIAGPILRDAHAYQIGSARDELAPAYRANAALLKRTPNLLVVSTSGAGYDSVDVKACTEAGVIVVNQSGGNAEAVAEHVLGMMLLLSKRVIEADRAVRRRVIAEREEFMGHDIFGRTIGIIGLGNVGRRLAELCRLLFRMRVIACDPYLTAQEIEARGAAKVTLPELLAASDFVSVNCPLTDETRGMIGAGEIALMPPHAYFITTARGSIHDEEALADALREKRLAGAGLDVWAREPPTPDHPLLGFDNVLVSPHTAGVTIEARANMGKFAAEQLIDIFDGKRPPRLINPEAWPAYARRFQQTFGFTPVG